MVDKARKNNRQRGRAAYFNGRSRDSHGKPENDPSIEHWTYGYDTAAAKNNYAVMPLRCIDTSQQAVIKTARMAKIIELCTYQPYNSRELATALEVTEACLRGYILQHLEDGALVKWRSSVSVSKGRPNTYYAIHEDQFDGFEDAPVRPVRKTWSGVVPPMFAPMAYLFGRASA